MEDRHSKKFKAMLKAKGYPRLKVRTIAALNAVPNPKTTVLANIMFEAKRKEGGRPYKRR